MVTQPAQQTRADTEETTVEEVTGVTFEEYYDKYAHNHYEWVEGRLYKVTPAGLQHNDIIFYMGMLFDAYFALRPIGRRISSPFLLKLSDEVAREPDLMVVLNDNSNTLTDTMMVGAPDICVEVVSPESVGRDRGTKFREYEAGGVREYWLIDPIRSEARFYRLGDKGYYAAHDPDASGNYTTPRLPDLVLHVPTLWQSPLPRTGAVAQSVEKMLANKDS